MIVLDHIVVAANTLAEGAAHVESSLGVALPEAIGVHKSMGTHNRLLSLGPGTYLEVIAVDPDASRPAHARWFDLDNFDGPPRIINWIARTDDLDAALAASPPGIGAPISFARGEFLWTMAVPPNGRLPWDGAAPALIQWESAVHPSERLPDLGCRLQGLTVRHPDAEALLAAFPMLAAVERVEIESNPQRSLRVEIETPSGRKRLA